MKIGMRKGRLKWFQTALVCVCMFRGIVISFCSGSHGFRATTELLR